ncbi:MAG TPA: host-nuclease inhibitor Gam family protein [Acidimicrobiales bacterium]
MSDQAQRDADIGDLIRDRELEAENAAERSYPDVWDDLDQHLIGQIPDRIEDHQGAERMVRSIARRRRQLARMEEVYKAEREHLDAWLARQRELLATTYFEECLAGYHQRLLEQDPKAKTIHLPSGDLTARAGQPTWEIDDEVFITWAQSCGANSLLRMTVSPDRAAIKTALQVNLEHGVTVDQAGEIVPGIRVTPGETSFKVKTGEAA